MATIREMAKRATQLKKGFPSIVAGSLWTNRGVYLDMNKAQMLKGIDSTGSLIGLYRQIAYERYKKSLGFIDTVNLRLTGAFQNRMVLTLQGFKSYEVKSVDGKAKKLEGKYGSTIFGLTPDNKETFVSTVLQPDVVRNADRILGGG